LSREEIKQKIVEEGEAGGRYADQLRRVAAGMGLEGADIDDVLQGVYVEAASRTEGFGQAEEELYWMIRVTINRCRQEYRRRGRYRHMIGEITRRQEQQRREAKRPEEELIEREEIEAVRQALRGLEESLQEPMALKYFGGLSSEEIGEVLELKPGTVRKRIYQGRIRLAEAMKKKTRWKDEG
jgi:RNA polymerase sigma-70 factor (ECF subfamily)